MTRQEKIKLLEAVRDGMPVKYLSFGAYPLLIKKPGETVWKHGDIIVTEQERLKWLPHAITIINKTGGELDKNGMPI